MASEYPQIDLSHIQHPASIKRVNGRLPNDTNITALGISATAAKILTPAASKLTKAELTALGEHPEAVQAKLGLTVKDIQSIKSAFSTPLHIGAVGTQPHAIDVSCCCCTPCCSAAAVPEALTIC